MPRLVPPRRYGRIQQLRAAGKWTYSDSRPKVINNLLPQFNAIRKRAGIPDRSFRELRSTALTNWFAMGLKEYEVMRRTIWWTGRGRPATLSWVRFWRVLGARPWIRREKNKAAKHKCLTAFDLQNEAEGARTLNLRIDSPMLYPIELRPRILQNEQYSRQDSRVNRFRNNFSAVFGRFAIGVSPIFGCRPR